LSHDPAFSDLARAFGSIVGSDGVRLPRENEIRIARLIVEPSDAEQISEIVRKCESDEFTLAPFGAGRTLANIRRQPASVGVSLARMNRVVHYEPDDMTIVAQAGLTLGALNSATAKHSQRLPCDPPNPELTTLGALVSAAKSGPFRLSEGRPRDLLIGIQFVGHDGRLIRGGGRVVKNVAGYDLMKVMTGAFGTLGIITETTFKVRPTPENYSLAIASFDQTGEALAAAQRAEQAANLIHLEVLSRWFGEKFDRPGRMVVLAGFGGSNAEVEYFRAHVRNALRRNTQLLSGHQAIFCYNCLRDVDFTNTAVVAQIAVLPAELTRCLQALAAEFRSHPAVGVAQVFLPSDSTDDEVEEAVARWRDIAHSAGGHLRVLQARQEVSGRLEMFDLPTDGALSLMRRLKETFDPKNIFNPGCFVAGM
jgi:glycolate oxidase FAD binding subunit